MQDETSGAVSCDPIGHHSGTDSGNNASFGNAFHHDGRRIVTLVATNEMLGLHFPDRVDALTAESRGIKSAGFAFNVGDCQTVLGRWLATHIMTTRRDDDASRCTIALPSTRLDSWRVALSYKLRSRHSDQSEQEAKMLLDEMQDRIAEQRSYLEQGPTSARYPLHLQPLIFAWPVFGSAAAGGMAVDTPSAYFDLCAVRILETGGAIAKAGLMDVRPPETLLRTMARGSGLELLALYDKQYEHEATGGEAGDAAPELKAEFFENPVHTQPGDNLIDKVNDERKPKSN